MPDKREPKPILLTAKEAQCLIDYHSMVLRSPQPQGDMAAQVAKVDAAMARINDLKVFLRDG